MERGEGIGTFNSKERRRVKCLYECDSRSRTETVPWGGTAGAPPGLCPVLAPQFREDMEGLEQGREWRIAEGAGKGLENP